MRGEPARVERDVDAPVVDAESFQDGPFEVDVASGASMLCRLFVRATSRST